MVAASRAPAVSQAASSEIEPECPLTRDQLGRHTWAFLHTMAAYYPERPNAQQQRHMGELLERVGEFFPCESCSADFRYKYY